MNCGHVFALLEIGEGVTLHTMQYCNEKYECFYDADVSEDDNKQEIR